MNSIALYNVANPAWPYDVRLENSPVVSHCIILSGNETGTGSTSEIPLFADINNPLGPDYIYGTADDGLRLLPCSPGIDAGTNEGVSVQTDLIGVPRIQNGTIDIGPYEYQGSKSAQILATDLATDTRYIDSNRTKVFMADGLPCNVIVRMQSLTNLGQGSWATVKVWVDAQQPVDYVKRHYQIIYNLNNDYLTSAWTTLYATDAEFAAFNAQTPAPSLLLPLSSDDPATRAARTANLLIERRSGSSSLGTGKPSTYGASSNIDPADSDITWNSSEQRWEIRFLQKAPGGFFIKTNPGVLPVHWVSVAAGLSTENQPLIRWKVQETAVASYLVQRSRDARIFETIGKVEG